MAIALSKTKSYSDERPMKIRDSLGSIDELSGRVAESRSVPGSWSRGRDRKYSTLADLFCVKDNEAELESVITDNSSSPNMPISPPPPPFVLNFTNLHYSVKRKQGGGPFGGRRSRLQAADHVEDFQQCGNQKIVLNDISGEARDGEILAVMGHSGSGKSTLIDALAQRISKDSLKGSMTLNHEPLQSKVFRSISAYVMQDDLLFPMLTVEETLNFAAEFRLPSSFTKEQKRARVEALLDQLGLRSAANTIIGDEGHRGVSGGERRRVSIGIDIIHDPILLFLDEPTSGLDSTSAFMVVKVLQRIARTGSIIVMSIHQPSYRILGILDKIMLLAHGHTVFSGRPQNLGNYFAGFGRPVPENENSTEFALDLVRELEATSGGVKPLLEYYKSWSAVDPENNTLNIACMPLKDAIGASIARGKLVADTNENGIPVANFANKPLKEMLVLTSRAFTNLRRTPELFLMRLGTVMFTGFMLATIFWKLDASPKGIRERLGVFAFAMSTTFYTCADALPVFLQERYIFMRETAYNAYRRSSYVLAHAIVSMPSLVILAAAFASVTFWTVGLGGGTPGFFFFFLMMLASFWTANSFVTFLSGVVSNLMIAYTIVVALLAYFLLMSGFFITRDRIPAYWIWFHYISLIKYPYEGVLLNEFGRSDACFARGSEVFEGTPIQALPPQMQQSFLGLLRTTTSIDITPTTCVTTGRDVLHAQGVTELSKWSCLVITVAWGVFFRVFFYVSLVLGSKNKRH